MNTTTNNSEWDRYYADLKAHEEIYEQKRPKIEDFTSADDYEKALREWDFAKHMDEPNKPGYLIANND